MNKTPVTENDLHAYADAALPAARRDEVEDYLADHPEAATQVAAWQSQNRVLRSHFQPLMEAPIPAHLEALALGPLQAPAPRPSLLPAWSWQRLAAGFLLTVLGGALGWLGHGQYQARQAWAQAVPLPRQAAVAHAVYSPEVRRPVEVSAEQEEQLVTWLSKRLGTPVRVPKLGEQGFQLVGGRLLPGNAGPVAQFMYQDAQAQRLTLYLSTEGVDGGNSAFRFAQEGKVNVFYWVDGRFAYALSGTVAKGDLAAVATAVYHHLHQP